MLISESRKTNYIVIEKDKCKACLYCISVCPREIIGISKEINRFGVNYAELIAEKAFICTGCKACAIMCPDLAITIYHRSSPDDDTTS
ncbi:MAG: 4Fe-4S dicluster domain-containing protein [Dehalococcoidia bacterium]